MQKIMVHFPWLHPQLAGTTALSGVVLFDPGVDMPGDVPRWRPDDLPYTALEVRRMLRDYLTFGESFARPSDMRFYQAQGMENFYTDSTMDILSQLNSAAAGAPVAETEDPDAKRKQAQLLLAMALFREEQFVTMHEQEARFEGAREGFAQVLGLDDEESFAELGMPADAVIFPRASVDLPWKTVLEPLLCLVDADTTFFISDPDVVQEMVNCGLHFAPCTEDGAACIESILDAEAMTLLCGRQIAHPGSVRLVAVAR